LRRLGETLHGSLYFALVVEALISGFYVMVTRSLSPILMAFVGMEIQEILAINILASFAAVMTALVLYYHREFLLRDVKIKLLAFHGSARLAWGILPLCILHPIAFYVDFILAVALSIPTTAMITELILSCFDEEEAKKLIARRTALAAFSGFVGQGAIVAVLAGFVGLSKYVMLYVSAMAVGLIATAMIALSKMPSSIEAKVKVLSEEAEAEITDVFIFLTLFLSSNAILGIAWSPYLMNVLGAPDYLAALVCFSQLATSIAASLFWAEAPYRRYKYALAAAAAIPVAIMFTTNPWLHIGIAAAFAFTYTGANLLAATIYAGTIKGAEPSKAAILLSTTQALAQVLGLGIALAIYGLGPGYMFAAATLLLAFAAVLAMLTVPEFAVVPEHYVKLYARMLYRTSTAGYGFMIMTTKRTVILTLKLLAASFILLFVYIVYRMLYYLLALSRG